MATAGVYDGVIQFDGVEPMCYASYGEEGGIDWFEDYFNTSGPDDMPKLVGRAGFLFQGKTIQFGWCNDDSNSPDYFAMYLIDCCYYRD